MVSFFSFQCSATRWQQRCCSSERSRTFVQEVKSTQHVEQKLHRSAKIPKQAAKDAHGQQQRQRASSPCLHTPSCYAVGRKINFVCRSHLEANSNQTHGQQLGRRNANIAREEAKSDDIRVLWRGREVRFVSRDTFVQYLFIINVFLKWKCIFKHVFCTRYGKYCPSGHRYTFS